MVQALQSEVTIAPEKQEIEWTCPVKPDLVKSFGISYLIRPTCPAHRLLRIGGIKRLQKKSM